jgi:hypothetical protein
MAPKAPCSARADTSITNETAAPPIAEATANPDQARDEDPLAAVPGPGDAKRVLAGFHWPLIRGRRSTDSSQLLPSAIFDDLGPEVTAGGGRRSKIIDGL